MQLDRAACTTDAVVGRLWVAASQGAVVVPCRTRGGEGREKEEEEEWTRVVAYNRRIPRGATAYYMVFSLPWCSLSMVSARAPP